jgi:hypothetical protein
MSFNLERDKLVARQIEELARFGLSKKEVSRSVQISEPVFLGSDWCKEAFEKGRTQYHKLLKLKLFDIAMDDGNKSQIAALIFSCKAVLGMRDSGPAPVDEDAPKETAERPGIEISVDTE